MLKVRTRLTCVLLILGNQVCEVGFCLGKLHLVHSLASVLCKVSVTISHQYATNPMSVRSAPEQLPELVVVTLEYL